MANVKPGHRRKELVLPTAELDKIEYWANAQDKSVSEFILAATSLYIKFINEDYDLPTLEQQRLNQLIDSQLKMSVELRQLEETVRSTSAVLLRTTNGRNYLEDISDGE